LKNNYTFALFLTAWFWWIFIPSSAVIV